MTHIVIAQTQIHARTHTRTHTHVHMYTHTHTHTPGLKSPVVANLSDIANYV